MSAWVAHARGLVGIHAVDAFVRLDDLAAAEDAARIVGDLGPEREAPRDFIQARLAAGRGDHRAAAELLRPAAEFFERVGYSGPAWLARLRLAESLVALDDAERGGRELERVIAQATELGNPFAVRQARELMQQLGLGTTSELDSTTGPERAAPMEAIPIGERLVTVLFADVRGYTAMSRESVPADTADRIGALQRWAKVEIEKRHGVVDKFAGDAVMATFNISGATVDHAVHALETALAIRDKAAALGLPLGVGIATGAAVVGALAPGANLSVVGETTNLASRLQGQAEAGDIVISEDVRRRILGWLESHPVQTTAVSLSLKGFGSQVPAYRLR